MGRKMTIDRKEIEDGIQTSGLFEFILTLLPQAYDDREVISSIASVASKRNPLISKAEKAYLEGIEDSKFFDIQTILCKIIPIINTNPATLMDLVQFLVERGGHDLAANLPNLAFRKWCKADLSRADEVIKLARSGNATAREYLTFALEAKGDVLEAILCLERSPGEQRAGALALSRMRPDENQSSIALKKIIRSAKKVNSQTAYQFVKAAYDIAAKHPQMHRNKLQKLLDNILIPADTWVIHLAAKLLNHHYMEMTETEVDLCINRILKVDPSNKGTINEIDKAMVGLLENGKIHKVSSVVYKMIQDSNGKFNIKLLKSLSHALAHKHTKALAQLVTNWLQRGDLVPCFSLQWLVSDLNKDKPTIDVHDIPLPSSTKAQIFLCRRAIGYLFLQPMTAAAFSVAVIDRGQPDAKAHAQELLFNPLLLNYSGALVEWLRNISIRFKDRQKDIDEVLERTDIAWGGVKSPLEVIELQPSKTQRDVTAFHEMEEAEYIRDKVFQHSVVAKIGKNEHMLYGDETAISSIGDADDIGYQTIQYSKIEVNAEFPKGFVIDPVGLEIMLDKFRRERIA